MLICRMHIIKPQPKLSHGYEKKPFTDLQYTDKELE
jgi:hypothetical protein